MKKAATLQASAQGSDLSKSIVVLGPCAALCRDPRKDRHLRAGGGSDKRIGGNVPPLGFVEAARSSECEEYSYVQAITRCGSGTAGYVRVLQHPLGFERGRREHRHCDSSADQRRRGGGLPADERKVYDHGHAAQLAASDSASRRPPD